MSMVGEKRPLEDGSDLLAEPLAKRAHESGGEYQAADQVEADEHLMAHEHESVSLEQLLAHQGGEEGLEGHEHMMSSAADLVEHHHHHVEQPQADHRGSELLAPMPHTQPAADPEHHAQPSAEQMDPSQHHATDEQLAQMGQQALQVGLPYPTTSSTTKTCLVCRIPKPVHEFHIEQRNPDGLCNKCKSCKKLGVTETLAPTISHKQCKKCSQTKPASEFGRNKHCADGLQGSCNECRRANLREITTPTVEEKECSKCNMTKPAADFDRYKRTVDGLHTQCKACMKAARPKVDEPTVTAKTCAKCRITKPADEFCRQTTATDGLQCYCKACKAALKRGEIIEQTPSPAPGSHMDNMVITSAEMERLVQMPGSEAPTTSDAEGMKMDGGYQAAMHGPTGDMWLQAVQDGSLRTCQVCHQHKPAADFRGDPTSPDGLAQACAACEMAGAHLAHPQQPDHHHHPHAHQHPHHHPGMHHHMEPTAVLPAEDGQGGMGTALLQQQQPRLATGSGASRTKTCSRCGVNKPANQFPVDQQMLDGLHSHCKACKRAALPHVLQPTVEQKECKKCWGVKPAREFGRDRYAIDGLRATCQLCMRAGLPEVLEPTVTHKRCSKCGDTKTASEFDRYKRTVDGLQSQCKACMKAARKTVLEPTVTEKLCARCGETKPAGDFFKQKNSSVGLQSYCKACKYAIKVAKRQAPNNGSVPLL